MNMTEMIAKVSEKTGFGAEICEAVIKAFEKQSEVALENKFKGIKTDRETLVANIAEQTGLEATDCGKIVDALDGSMDEGLAGKLNIFKRNK